MNIVTVADLKDPNDEQGRTFRQINNARKHLFEVGTLVEIYDEGVRLFVLHQTRDCDGTPLYSLSVDSCTGVADKVCIRGMSEEYMKAVMEETNENVQR